MPAYQYSSLFGAKSELTYYGVKLGVKLAAGDSDVCSEPDTCALQRRWRDAETGTQFYSYGETPEDAERTVREIARVCLAAFDELEERWGEGRALLTELPPERIAPDADVFAELLRAETVEKQHEHSDRMYLRQLFPEWYPHLLPVCLLLAHLSRAYGQPTSIPRYLELALHRSQAHLLLPKIREYIWNWQQDR
jgi:hypothetical protein